MKKYFLLSLVSCIWAVSIQAVTITNEPDIPGNIGLFWGEDESLPSVSVAGQTFRVPGGMESRLTDFSFWLYDLLGEGTFFYDFVVAEWDQSTLKPVTELFRQKQRWDSAGNDAWNEIGIRDESIGVDAAKTYIAILDGTRYQEESVYRDGSTSLNMRVRAYAGGENPIEGGLFYGAFRENAEAVINPVDRSYDASLSDGFDLAYSARFQQSSTSAERIPDSGTSLLFLGSGLVAIVLISRRAARS